MAWKMTLVGTDVAISKRKSSGIIGSYIRPSGWMGDNMMPPIYRDTIIQTDVVTIIHYRGLTEDFAKAQAIHADHNGITTDAQGRITQHKSAEAYRTNEACGWTLAVMQVNSSYAVNTIVVVAGS